MATLLKANGQVVFGLIADTLEKKQEAVGGYIEIVPITDDASEFKNFILIVNEEGYLRGLPYNSEASRLAGKLIVGDVLLTLKSSID